MNAQRTFRTCERQLSSVDAAIAMEKSRFIKLIKQREVLYHRLELLKNNMKKEAHQ